MIFPSFDLLTRNRFIASAGTYANLVRQAKSKQKIIDKMEAAGLIEKVEAGKQLRFVVLPAIGRVYPVNLLTLSLTTAGSTSKTSANSLHPSSPSTTSLFPTLGRRKNTCTRSSPSVLIWTRAWPSSVLTVPVNRRYSISLRVLYSHAKERFRNTLLWSWPSTANIRLINCLMIRAQSSISRVCLARSSLKRMWWWVSFIPFSL